MLDVQAIRAYLQALTRVSRVTINALRESINGGHPLNSFLLDPAIPNGERQTLSNLHQSVGVEPSELCSILEELADALELEAPAPEIVWTGPQLSGVGPIRATFPIARALISTTCEALIIAGYVTHVQVLEKLGIRSALNNGAKVTLLMDNVDWNDHALRTLMAQGVSIIDASPGGQKMAKFHAKVVVSDGKAALVTSANFTHLGHSQNVELGVLLRGRPARQIAQVLDRYANSVARAGEILAGQGR